MMLSNDILVVTPTPSHPQDSGNRKRIYSLFKYLQSNSFKIHFVLYNVYGVNSYCTKSYYDAMRQEWDYFDFVMPSPDHHKILPNFRNQLFRSSHYKSLLKKGIRLPIQFGLDDWCSDSLINFVKWKCSNFSISAVFVEYVFLSKVFESVPNSALKIIDTHDVFANRHVLLFKNKMEVSFFSTSPREEIRGLNRSDLVITIQEEEKKYFEKYVKPSVVEVSHLEDKKFIEKDYQNLQSVGIISSGNAINVYSVQKFIDLVSQKTSLRTLRIYIAGSVCKGIVSSLPNVSILNYVDSLDEFYSLADLYINPMISGTGIKIKTLEAFSYGVPFLSTQSGSIGTGSAFKFHNFSTLNELVDYLDEIFKKQVSLKSYQEASKQCFDNYQLRLKSQLDSLVTYINNHRAGLKSKPESV